jgi:N-acetylmuramoyl-L-alanine amidase
MSTPNYTLRATTEYLVIHCSATPPSMDVGEEDIRTWHKAKGWIDIGYNIVIRRNGIIEIGRPLDYAGAHVEGYNNRALGICLVGGTDNNQKAENNFTVSQWKSLILALKFCRCVWPTAKITGHRDLILPGQPMKECPSFDVATWLKDINLDI